MIGLEETGKFDINTPIFITGCARSGTSLTAGVISLCGAFGGKLVAGNKHNIKGMFENNRLKSDCVKTLLAMGKWDVLGQYPLPEKDRVLGLAKDRKLVASFRKRITGIIEKDGYTEGPWFFKDAKLILCWEFWSRCFPNAIWIIVRRKKKDIVSSCMRTSFMRAFRDRDGWELWVEEHEQIFKRMKKSRKKVYEIWPAYALDNNLEPFKNLIESIGLVWNEKEVSDFAESGLLTR